MGHVSMSQHRMEFLAPGLTTQGEPENVRISMAPLDVDVVYLPQEQQHA